jgi:hypothetical protein
VACGIPTTIPGINQHTPLDRLTPALQKKKLNNKQETEEHATEGVGCSEHTGEDGKGKMLISVRTFIKQRLEK